MTLYTVARLWEDKDKLKIHSITVKATKRGYSYVSGERSPFHFRSRFGPFDYAQSPTDAVARFVKSRKQDIEISKHEIREAEQDLQDALKLVKARD